MPAENGFMQNHGQERIESVIYVNVVSIDGNERILFVNAQLTPVDATVNTLRAELVWITVIMIVIHTSSARSVLTAVSYTHLHILLSCISFKLFLYNLYHIIP